MQYIIFNFEKSHLTLICHVRNCEVNVNARSHKFKLRNLLILLDIYMSRPDPVSE